MRVFTSPKNLRILLYISLEEESIMLFMSLDTAKKGCPIVCTLLTSDKVDTATSGKTSRQVTYFYSISRYKYNFQINGHPVSNLQTTSTSRLYYSHEPPRISASQINHTHPTNGNASGLHFENPNFIGDEYSITPAARAPNFYFGGRRKIRLKTHINT